MTQRNTPDTIEWLKEHETTGGLGYNPDGRCLQITREARNLPAVYPSAYSLQKATPQEHRVYDISKIVKGMIGLYDDPADDNPYGHVVTYLGWIKDAPRNTLHNLLCKTNSVQSGRLTVVRADYFQRYWGDEFQFAATWLNGYELDLPEKKAKPKPKPIQEHGKDRLQKIAKELTRLIEIQQEKGNQRAVRALRRDKREIINTLEKFA